MVELGQVNNPDFFGSSIELQKYSNSFHLSEIGFHRTTRGRPTTATVVDPSSSKCHFTRETIESKIET